MDEPHHIPRNKDTELNAFHTMPSVLFEVSQNLKTLYQYGRKLTGVSTGIPELDYYLTGGLLNSNLTILATRPGVGKTSMLLGIGLNAARTSGKAVAYFSLELSTYQLVARLLSCEARVDSYRMLNGILTADNWKQLGEASAGLMELPILFDDNPGISAAEMKEKCRSVQNLGLVIVDYLQLVQDPRKHKRGKRVKDFTKVTHALKVMAKELDVPVLCAMQLPRKSKRPLLYDLRKWGNIEYDADAVLLLHREWFNNPDADPDAAEIIVAKNRYGRTGIIELFWSGAPEKG